MRPTIPTQSAEFTRAKKPGLQRSPRPPSGVGRGAPAPDAGYALTIAHREVAKLDFAHDHDRHDVEMGVALVAVKRASLEGRGPTLGDVRVALSLFDLGDGVITRAALRSFSGLAHSYAAQRHFVDAIDAERLSAARVISY